MARRGSIGTFQYMQHQMILLLSAGRARSYQARKGSMTPYGKSMICRLALCPQVADCGRCAAVEAGLKPRWAQQPMDVGRATCRNDQKRIECFPRKHEGCKHRKEAPKSAKKQKKLTTVMSFEGEKVAQTSETQNRLDIEEPWSRLE